MLYRLFVYKSSAATGTAPAVGIVNVAVSTNSEHEWKGNDAAHFMEHFDAAGIKNKIEDELGDKCKVKICFPPREYEQKEYLYIATSYARIREVLPRVHAIVMENRLALYDAESGKSFYKSLFDDTFITIRMREQKLKACITNELKPVWNIRKISTYENERDKSTSYSVTLKKIPSASFLDRTRDFYNCLSNNLKDGEKLVCEDKSFSVVGKWYTITFVLEGYKKHANMVGYYENGYARQELTHRMSVEEAYKWMDCCSDVEKKDIQKRMNFREMEDRFPNPSDRIVNSVRITKWQRKQVFDIRYSGFGYYGSEILFHIVPDDYYQDGDNISVLKIEEESASYILPFIHDVYPHFYERYYLAENHLPTEMWRRIINRIREAQDMVVNNTYCAELKKYIDNFNLFVLNKNNDPRIWDKNHDVDFVYEHRYEIAYLYEIFIQWSETQMYYYEHSGDDRMFNIQGP